RTYLYAAARNQAAKRYQSFGRETALEELVEEPQSADRQGPMAQVLDGELAGAVERAIASLPPLQREALVLFEYENLSLAEIAAVVGADSGTVKSRLFRARERLRVRLDRYFRIGHETATVRRA
ncbi:MAG: polymerase sigma-70 factor, subfamily, partial [Blastocatellia bacterium]|nr:polymerase sigma-70 factor, subfamily [Blastocatellia bacterium]